LDEKSSQLITLLRKITGVNKLYQTILSFWSYTSPPAGTRTTY